MTSAAQLPTRPNHLKPDQPYDTFTTAPVPPPRACRPDCLLGARPTGTRRAAAIDIGASSRRDRRFMTRPDRHRRRLAVVFRGVEQSGRGSDGSARAPQIRESGPVEGPAVLRRHSARGGAYWRMNARLNAVSGDGEAQRPCISIASRPVSRGRRASERQRHRPRRPHRRRFEDSVTAAAGDANQEHERPPSE